MIINNCGYCSSEIKTYPSVNKKFCGNECRNADYRNRRGENTPCWKGDKVSYSGLHKWVNKTYGKADKCEQCGSESYVDWANKSGEYKRDRGDWLNLCRKCHFYYDGRNEVLTRWK